MAPCSARSPAATMFSVYNVDICVFLFGYISIPFHCPEEKCIYVCARVCVLSRKILHKDWYLPTRMACFPRILAGIWHIISWAFMTRIGDGFQYKSVELVNWSTICEAEITQDKFLSQFQGFSTKFSITRFSLRLSTASNSGWSNPYSKLWLMSISCSRGKMNSLMFNWLILLYARFIYRRFRNTKSCNDLTSIKSLPFRCISSSVPDMSDKSGNVLNRLKLSISCLSLWHPEK